MAEKGIFISVLPALDLAAMAAVVSQMKAIFGKAGKDISASLDGPAAAIKRLENEMMAATNKAADANLRAAKQQAEANLIAAKAETARKKAVEERTISEQKALAINDAMQARAATSAANAAKAQQQAEEAAAKHGKAAEDAAGGVNRLGMAMNAVGLGATTAFAAGLGESIKQAMDFEAQTTQMGAALDETNTQIKAVADGLMQLAPQVGRSLSELSRASFLVGKMGWRDAAENIRIVGTAAQLASIEGAPLENTVKALTTAMRDFNFTVEQSPDIASKLRAAIGDAGVPMDEFTGSLHTLQPVFKSLLGDNKDPQRAIDMFAQMNAMLAMATRNGTGADQAAQNLLNTMQHLISMETKQRTMIDQLGGSSQQITTDTLTKGPLEAMREINELIKSKMGPDQRVYLSELRESADANARLKESYEALPEPMKRAADGLKAGTIPLKELRELSREGPDAGKFKDFLSQWGKATGFDPLNQKFMGAMVPGTSMTVPQALKEATGSQFAYQQFAQLFGTPEAEQQTYGIKNDVMNAHSIHGQVQGFNQIAETGAFQLKQMKAELQDIAVIVGQKFLPEFKGLVDLMKDFFGFLKDHQSVLDMTVKSFETLAELWVGSKILNGLKGMRSAFQGLNGDMRNVVTTAGQATTAMGEVGNTANAQSANVQRMAGAEQNVAQGERAIAEAAPAAAMGEREVGTAAGQAVGPLSAEAGGLSRVAGLMSWIGRNKGALLAGGLGAGLGAMSAEGGIGDKFQAGTMQGGIGLSMMGLPEVGGPLALASLGGGALSHFIAGLTADPHRSSQSLKDAQLNDQLKGALDKLVAEKPDQAQALLGQLRKDGRNDIADYIESKGLKQVDMPPAGPPALPPGESPEFNTDYMGASPDFGGGGGGGSGKGKGSRGIDQGDLGYNMPDFPALYNTAEGLLGTPYGQGGIDCSGLATAIIHPFLRDGKGMSDRLTTANAQTWLPAHGFVLGEPPGPGYFAVGWYDHGGGQNGHMAVTLPDGTNLEQGGSGNVVTTKGAGAFSSEFDHHAYYPVPMQAAMMGGGMGPGGMSSGGGLMGSGLPSSGRMGRSGEGVYNPLEQLGSGGFTLPNVAKVLTTFLAELALGNPLGHLMNSPGGKYAWWAQLPGMGGAEAQPNMPDLTGMNAEQLRSLGQTNKMAEAQERLNAAIAKYGPNSQQAIHAMEHMRDLQVSQTESNLTHAAAVEHHEEALAQKQQRLQDQANKPKSPNTIPEIYAQLGGAPGPGLGGPSTWRLGGGPDDGGGLFPGDINNPWGGTRGHAGINAGIGRGAGGIIGMGGDSRDAIASGFPNLGRGPGGVGAGLGGPMGGSSPMGGPSGGGAGGSAGGASAQLGSGNSSKGFGLSGGVIGTAGGAAAMAADAFAPGSGAAAQLAMQEANRFAGYLGQLGGIAAEGLLETFSLNDSPLADPSKSLPGKVIFGLAGAHPNLPNSAGMTQPPLKKDGGDKNPQSRGEEGKGSGGVHIENQIFNGDKTDADEVNRGNVQSSMMYSAAAATR